MVRSEGNMSLMVSVTPSGIDPETVRLVAQRLNHYPAPGPIPDDVLTQFDPPDDEPLLLEICRGLK